MSRFLLGSKRYEAAGSVVQFDPFVLARQSRTRSCDFKSGAEPPGGRSVRFRIAERWVIEEL